MPPTLIGNAIAPVLAGLEGMWTQVYAIGIPLFFMLALFTFIAAAAVWVLAPELQVLFEGLVQTLIGVGISYWLFINADSFLRFGYIGTMLTWGGRVGGISPDQLSADGALQTGWQLANTIFHAVGISSFLHATVASIITLLGGIFVFGVFAWSAVLIAELQVESFGAVVLGAPLLVLSALPFFSSMLGAWLGWIISIGVRLFVLLALFAIATAMVTNEWLPALTAAPSITSDISVVLQVVVGSLVYLMLIVHFPKRIASLASNGVGVSLASAAGSAANAAGAAAEVASAGAGVAGAAMDTAGSIGSTSSQEVFAASREKLMHP